MLDTITMPRGDLRGVNFTVYDSDDVEVSKPFTQITFTVKSTSSERRIIFQKKLTDGTITRSGNTYSFEIVPEDTDYIDYGTYLYDIELIRADTEGKHADIIHSTFVGKLIITDEVTFPHDTEKVV